MTSDLFGNATSSQESPGGQKPSDSPGGTTSGKSGPEAARVSRFRSLEKDSGLTTSATSGPLFTASSPSADLQRSLENRLRLLLDVNGSPEFVLTWKPLDMPAGLPICRLQASPRRTGGKDSGGSARPTPMRPNEDSGNSDFTRKIEVVAGLRPSVNAPMASAWPTPTNGDAKASGSRNLEGSKAHPGVSLTDAVLFGNSETPRAWPTPKASDLDGGRTTKTEGGGNSHLPIAVREASPRATPRASDGEKGGPNMAFGAGGTPLPAMAAQMTSGVSPRATPRAMDATSNVETTESRVARGSSSSVNLPTMALDASLRPSGLPRATPSARDWKDTPGMATTGVDPDGSTRTRIDQLPRQATAASGPAPSGEPGPTARRGALNPALPSWLMGFRPEWESCLPTSSDWRKWQALMEQVSAGRNDTGSEP